MLLSNQSITGWLFPRKRSFSWNKREKANFHSEWPLRVLLHSSCSWPHWWDESCKIPPIQSRFLFHVSKLLTWCLSGHFVCWHFDGQGMMSTELRVDTITTVYEARPMQNWSSFFPAWSCVWVCISTNGVLFYDFRFVSKWFWRVVSFFTIVVFFYNAISNVFVHVNARGDLSISHCHQFLNGMGGNSNLKCQSKDNCRWWKQIESSPNWGIY